MQYCTKCQNICEDKLVTCPHCKRGKSLRHAKDEDMVFIERLNEIDAGEISVLLEENAVKHEVNPVPGGLSSSLYDVTESRTDKNLFVEYRSIETAKKIIEDYYFSTAPEMNEQPPAETNYKQVLSSSIAIIAFMVLAGLTVFFADSVADFLRNLFS